MICQVCTSTRTDNGQSCPFCGAPNQIDDTSDIGQIVADRYLLLNVIRSSKTSTVYLADDLTLHKNVAVDILSAPVDEKTFRDFEQEAQKLTQVKTPQLGLLHDFGKTEKGCAYLVTDHLVGETLATRMAKGPIPAAEARNYLWQLSQALAQPHRLGLVHRGICPTSILLSKQANSAEPLLKLLGFGSTKLVASIENSIASTMLGVGVGDLRYMPPEKVEGRALDAASDLYVVGIIVYEMLTGLQAKMMRSQLSPQAEVPSTPAWLDQLVQDLTEKKPAKRVANVQELQRRLSEQPGHVAASPAMGAASMAAPARAKEPNVAMTMLGTVPKNLGDFAASAIPVTPVSQGGVSQGGVSQGGVSQGVARGVAQGVSQGAQPPQSPQQSAAGVVDSSSSNISSPNIIVEGIRPGANHDLMQGQSAGYTPPNGAGQDTMLGRNAFKAKPGARSGKVLAVAAVGVIIVAAVVFASLQGGEEEPSPVAKVPVDGVVEPRAAAHDAGAPAPKSRPGSEYDYTDAAVAGSATGTARVPVAKTPEPIAATTNSGSGIVEIVEPSEELIQRDSLPQIRADESSEFTDLNFAVRDAVVDSDGNYTVKAFARFESTVVGVEVWIKAGLQAPIERRNTAPKIFYTQSAIAIRSVGKTSNALLAAMANIYAVRMPAASMKREVLFTAAAEQGKPREIDDHHVTFRISYANPDIFGEFGEAYLLLDLANSKMFIKERDINDRGAIIKALSTSK